MLVACVMLRSQLWLSSRNFRLFSYRFCLLSFCVCNMPCTRSWLVVITFVTLRRTVLGVKAAATATKQWNRITRVSCRISSSVNNRPNRHVTAALLFCAIDTPSLFPSFPPSLSSLSLFLHSKNADGDGRGEQ